MEDSREKLTRVSLENERKETEDRDFPSSPVVKTSSFQSRGCRFDPLSGTKIPPACAVWQKKKKVKESEVVCRDSFQEIPGREMRL